MSKLVPSQTCIYIAGPMRGYDKYNFDAFDHARNELTRAGFARIVSPADLDRSSGFNADTDEATPEFVREAMARDLEAIAKHCTHICLLDGWEDSEGVDIELRLAAMLGLKAFTLQDFLRDWEPLTCVPAKLMLAAKNCEQPAEDTEPSTIAAEADAITQGARHSDYGHPLDNFRHTAALWNAMFDINLTPEQVGLAMILFKLSREHNKHKRDNLVDIAGYANCVQMALDRQEQEDIAADCIDEDSWPSDDCCCDGCNCCRDLDADGGYDDEEEIEIRISSRSLNASSVDNDSLVKAMREVVRLGRQLGA